MPRAPAFGLLVALAILCSPLSLARAGVSINIDIPLFPDLVEVPGYPVYYDPRGDSNYFFYDGAYWVYQDDHWYSSAWFNGPWDRVEPMVVPAYVLRVPVRYYRRPPTYFRGWVADAPPRWGDRWGRAWQDRRRGWDQWDRRARVQLAPLPVYQRDYAGDRYPRDVERQHALWSQHYRYKPREALVRERYRVKQREERVERREERVKQQARTVQRREHRVERREHRVEHREQRALEQRQRQWERQNERKREAAEQRQRQGKRDKDRARRKD